MEATTLRWIIGIVGVVIIAGIFLFGNPDRKRKPPASRRRDRRAGAERREPTLKPKGASGAASGSGAGRDAMTRVDEKGQGELNIEPVDPSSDDHPVPPPKRPRRTRPPGPPPEKIVSLFLLAADNRRITGAELLEAAVKTGMDFGDMDIFHRIPEGANDPVFSLANAEKPGHFDREAWNTFETAGVVLFMTLPGPVFALDAWDAMLATARRMSEILHADLEDEGHHPFTRQKEAQVREQMRDFDRRQSTS